MSGGKDVPCNTHVYFRVNEGKLDMTVCCRSNDIYWGAYGANAVHFSFLQEFMASWIGVGVGLYYQISNNYHIYTNVVKESKFIDLAVDAIEHDHYVDGQVPTYPLVKHSAEAFLEDCENFVRCATMVSPAIGYSQVSKFPTFNEPFFPEVAVPMFASYVARKNGLLGGGAIEAGRIAAKDWRIACTDWLTRHNRNRSVTVEKENEPAAK
jgi:hypothetical protein